MDRFESIRAFVQVVESQSFTQAARVLGMSRATVSVSVRQLEEHIGARLLHRTTRQVSLTSEGERFLNRATRLLEDLESAEKLFVQHGDAIEGVLRVDAPTRITHRLLIPELPEFLARHPQLHVQIGARDQTSDLVERAFDAVVRVGSLPDSSLIAKRMGRLAQVNCASPAYLREHGTPSTLDDLRQHTLINYSQSLSGEAAWDYEVEGGRESVAMRTVLTVDTAESYIAACKAGIGLIQVPAYDVGEALEAGELVAVAPALRPPPIPISIAYPSRHHVPLRVHAFIDWAIEVFERRGVLVQPA